MTVKILLIAGLATAAALVFRGKTGATRRAMLRLGVSAMLTLGVGAVLFPNAVTALARMLGVGRGTDLVLYSLVVAFLLTAVGLYRKLHDLEDRYVTLVRQLAIAQADEDQMVDLERADQTAASPSTRKMHRLG